MVRRIKYMYKLGYTELNIALEEGISVEDVYQILALAIKGYTHKTPVAFIGDVNQEIQLLINYIPKATPVFKDIAVQRLKTLC